jgi:hypothetical protein
VVEGNIRVDEVLNFVAIINRYMQQADIRIALTEIRSDMCALHVLTNI